ncbi:UDP-phosphate glycosyltransferase [uncultured Serinicoccus sp.]|uniref:UDP-phosphate glycosyltransferase n=1 Tax=uncultured Serinicoccus sp. TaxID=735514 RepID=UPI0026203ED2|nr:UDP-phosphate glycosyltransferase [uncultured Serinicoccus sp.]
MSDLAPAALAVGAGVLTAASAPAVAPLLRSWGLVDVPNHRSSHGSPTLRGAGLALLLGILLTAGVAGMLGATGLPWVALGACAVTAGVGLAVDLSEPSPLVRLVLLALVGAALGSLLGGPGTALLGAVAMPVLVNVVNFMDGINGITALTALAWGLVAVLGAGTEAAVALGALTLGAAAGFLPWNLPRARMFLGDCGSYLVGALVTAALLLEQSGGGHVLLLLLPLLPSVVDTGLTLVRRAARGERLTEAHREHLYQRLSRRPGWTHGRVACLWAGLGLAGAGIWWLLRHNGAS